MNKAIAHPTREIVVWINLASLLSFACLEEDVKPLMLGFLGFKLQLPSLRHNKRNLIPRTAHLNKKTLRGVKQEEGTTQTECYRGNYGADLYFHVYCANFAE